MESSTPTGGTFVLHVGQQTRNLPADASAEDIIAAHREMDPDNRSGLGQVTALDGSTATRTDE